MTEEQDFWVECNVCGTQHKNWVGSTPCCGSIAWIVGEDGKPTDKITLFAKLPDGSSGAATLRMNK